MLSSHAPSTQNIHPRARVVLPPNPTRRWKTALIYNCARTATCVTTKNCILYRVNGETFRSILSSSNSDRVKKRCTESKAALLSLYNIGAVEELDERTLRALEIVLHPVTFERDDLVITKGAYDDMMFFVMSGKLLAHDIGTGDSR